jgi:hypothetical protein
VCGRRLAVLQAVGFPPLHPVLGFVPRSALIGDGVCFIRSCPVPLLMRKLIPADLESLDSRVHSVAKEGGAIPQRSEMLMTSSRIGSSRGKYEPSEEWDVEHFEFVGGCFVGELMYGLAYDVPKRIGVVVEQGLLYYTNRYGFFPPVICFKGQE